MITTSKNSSRGEYVCAAVSKRRSDLHIYNREDSVAPHLEGNLAIQPSTSLAAINYAQPRHLGTNVGEKSEAVRAKASHCAPEIRCRIIVTGTILVTYAEWHGDKMNRIKTIQWYNSHEYAVIRNKLIAHNLGLTVNTRTERVSVSKYVPHAGKKEAVKAARRAEQQQLKGATHSETEGQPNLQPTSRAEEPTS